MPMKRCNKCQEVKDTSEFYKHVSGKYKVCSWCKECMNEHVYARRIAEREKKAKREREKYSW